jgi:hypothetical protein
MNSLRYFCDSIPVQYSTYDTHHEVLQWICMMHAIRFSCEYLIFWCPLWEDNLGNLNLNNALQEVLLWFPTCLILWGIRQTLLGISTWMHSMIYTCDFLHVLYEVSVRTLMNLYLHALREVQLWFLNCMMHLWGAPVIPYLNDPLCKETLLWM